MKRLALVLPALFLFAFATDAQAGARIVTPRLHPPSDGSLVCYAVNASDKKDVMVEMTIYDLSGTLVWGPFPFTISPNASEAIATTDDAARHCVVQVLKGGKKNVRVTLTVRDSSNVPLVAVSGF